MDEAKKKRQFNKNYMYLNKTMVGLAIYVIFFPFMASIIEKINPEILVCPYLKMTGNPCPLCGGTRYFRGLGKVLTDPSYLLHPFGVMAIVILLEIPFRIFMINRIKKEKLNKALLIADIVIHTIIFVSFILYEILFFIW